MRTRPYFACERSVGVLAVFELDHRVILLEPFKTPHKGNFARSPAFNAWRTSALMLMKIMWRCSISRTGFSRECARQIALGEVPHQAVDAVCYHQWFERGVVVDPRCCRGDRVDVGGVDQDEPVAGAGVGRRRIVG